MKETSGGYYEEKEHELDLRENYGQYALESLNEGAQITDALLGTFAREFARRTNLSLRTKAFLIEKLKIHPGLIQIFS